MRWAFLSQVWVEDPTAVVSGSNVQVYYIARELAQRGEPVLVLLSGHAQPWEWEEGSLQVVSLPAVGPGLRGLFHPRWMRRAEGILRRFAPEVVYQRGKLPETVLAARYARRHGCLFLWCSNADNSAQRWKFVRKRLRYRRRPLWLLPARLLEAALADIAIERALRAATLVLAQTRYQQQTLRALLGKEPVIVGSGHPLPPPPQLTAENIPTVLWLANLTPVKQPLVFVRLAYRLRHTGARFLMAGAAPNTALLQAVQEACAQLPHLSYLGAVPFLKTAALFAQASVFVLTSEFEGIPNTFVQACLHGVPTLSLRNDPDGLIRTYGVGEVAQDEEELAHILEAWLQNPEQRRRAGMRAYELARSHFDIRAIVDRLQQLVYAASSKAVRSNS